MDSKLKKFTLNILIPLLISTTILFFLFKDISFSKIKETFLNISLISVLIFIVMAIIGAILRAIRYRILLSRQLSFIDMFLVTLVRNFAVDLLPARSAALILYTYLTRKRGISVAQGSSSFVVALFYDVLALAIMLGGMLVLMQSSLNRTVLVTAVFLLGIISLSFILLADHILSIIFRPKFWEKYPKIKRFGSDTAAYLALHKSPRERGAILLLSFFIRLFKYISLFILFDGVVNNGMTLNLFSRFCFGVAGTELSGLLPIQGIGGMGTWEAVFSTVFKAMKIPAGEVAITGLVIHVTTQLWEYTIGLAAFLTLHRRKQLSDMSN